MSNTTAVGGAVRVAIYKERGNTKPHRKFWAGCDGGWSATPSAMMNDVARHAEEHLLRCEGAPDSREDFVRGMKRVGAIEEW